jgi:hypothetical protein
MSYLLSEFYSSSKEIYKIRLMAGEKGLINDITWVYLAEDIENADFLRGNELVITTGLSAGTKISWLYELIRELIYRKCSGLLINTDKYILVKDISREVIELCNSENFPLFIMPWEMHISDIMQDYCNKIFMDKYLENTLSKLFYNVIFDSQNVKNYIPLLNSNGYPTESSYYAAKITNISSPLKLQNCINLLSIKYHIFLKNNYYILILQECSKKLLNNFMKNYFEIVDNEIASNSSILRPQIGIGEKVSSLSKLYFSYSTASYALKTAKDSNKDCVYFDDLGIFRILSSVSNKELLQNIYFEMLDPIIDYDRKNNTQLLKTLKVYLNFDGSIQKTANFLYNHRNTINYRMKKIHDLLKKDLTSTEDKFNLRMAFYIKEYMRL